MFFVIIYYIEQRLCVTYKLKQTPIGYHTLVKGRLSDLFQIRCHMYSLFGFIKARVCLCYSNSSPGHWSTSGCTVNSLESTDNKTVCKCDHLTNFAVVMSPFHQVRQLLSSLLSRSYTHFLSLVFLLHYITQSLLPSSTSFVPLHTNSSLDQNNKYRVEAAWRSG